jgi:hypothetical protein
MKIPFVPVVGGRPEDNGKYEKTVHFKHQSFRIPIMRRKCPDCKKTFSLSLAFISHGEGLRIIFLNFLEDGCLRAVLYGNWLNG